MQSMVGDQERLVYEASYLRSLNPIASTGNHDASGIGSESACPETSSAVPRAELIECKLRLYSMPTDRFCFVSFIDKLYLMITSSADNELMDLTDWTDEGLLAISARQLIKSTVAEHPLRPFILFCSGTPWLSI